MDPDQPENPCGGSAKWGKLSQMIVAVPGTRQQKCFKELNQTETTTDAEVDTIENRGIRAGSLLRDAEKAIEEGAKHR